MLPSRSAFPFLLAFAATLGASAQAFSTPKDLVAAMLKHETQPHTDHYQYQLLERSDRTGGHLWLENLVEVPGGRVYRVIAEDGKPLSPERVAAESDRLQTIATDPSAFEKTQVAQQKDELHAREMLSLLPRAFILDNPRLTNGVWHLDFHPDPDFSPSGMEERVLHGMTGSLVIDAADLRLIHIEAKLPTDMSIGFGLLATIRAGSRFLSDRQKIDGHWRTVHVVTDIRGKAALFKSVAKQSDLTRSQFRYLPADVTVAQAVSMLQRPEMIAQR